MEDHLQHNTYRSVLAHCHSHRQDLVLKSDLLQDLSQRPRKAATQTHLQPHHCASQTKPTVCGQSTLDRSWREREALDEVRRDKK